MWRAVERVRRLPTVGPLLEQVAAGQAPFVASAKLKLVDACNLRCFMCDYWKRTGDDDLTTDEVLAVLDDLAALGCEKVHFTGGELFLRRDALDLLGRAHALGMRVNLTTNGTVLDDARLDALLALPPRSITFSVDSPLAPVHDVVRGQEGAHARTTRTLDRTLRRRAKRTRVRLNTVLSARNLESLLGMPEFLRERPVDQWLLIPIDEKPGAASGGLDLAAVRYWSQHVAPALAAQVTVPGFDPWVFGRDEAAWAEAAAGRYALGHYRTHRCHVPWFHTLVDARGDVYPCCMGHRSLPPLGNVRERPLREVVAGPAYVAFRRAMLEARTDVCHRCDDFLAENRALDALLPAP
ncbi:MAG: radical SAM protein [Planctomycetes bacterium]|nr:radical SAM protein [Planctomycetota bacterium]